MGTLAEIAGLGWYVYVVDLSLAFTIGASMIACFSWVARFMMTMSREGVAPAAWGRVHPKYSTPVAALNVAGIVWLIEVVAMGSISDTPLATFGQAIGDMGGYPLLLVYGLVCIGAIRFQWKRGKRTSVYILIGVLGAVAMAYTLYDNLNPWPAFPNNVVPIIFVVTTITIVVAYYIVKRRRPTALSEIGSTLDSSD
jgi:amino acid transporter